MIPRLLAALFVAFLLAIVLACSTTGDRDRDESRRQLLVLACKSQCSVALTLVVDACDGKLDGVSAPDPEKPLQTVCIAEANLGAAACPLACEEIPLPKDTPDPEPVGLNAAPAE